MSQTLPPITLANALAAYKNADANGKKLLENLHGKKPFTECMSIMERVSNFNDICEIGGGNPNDYILSRARDAREGEISDLAYEKIKLIVKTLNEGWKPNWVNDREYKYCPHFKYNLSAAWCSHTDSKCVGSLTRLIPTTPSRRLHLSCQ